ncbi:MAG TPA: HAD-IIA family hydrolase [Anaerolineales bacterium]|nr:HAD-IIA family hydrolase [Anaerolineales bacterium]
MSGLLDQLSPPVRGLILDMDGVLWKDDTPIGDLPKIFNGIRDRNLKVTLATNNATKTVDEYLSKLRGLGVALEPWQIITSSEATADVVEKAFPQKGAVFVIGENGIISALREKGFNPITDPDDDSPVLAVVVGIDRGVTYQKLRRATLHIRAATPFYGTNPDKTFPTPLGLVPGAGAILASIEAATDIKPIVIGKPAPFMLELAADRMKLSKGEVLVVGDRLETDIAGGRAMGARTALVLSGVSTESEADAWRPGPDLIATDLAELVN